LQGILLALGAIPAGPVAAVIPRAAAPALPLTKWQQ
jgi:hypothetical protein